MKRTISSGIDAMKCHNSPVVRSVMTGQTITEQIAVTEAFENDREILLQRLYDVL